MTRLRRIGEFGYVPHCGSYGVVRLPGHEVSGRPIAGDPIDHCVIMKTEPSLYLP